MKTIKSTKKVTKENKIGELIRDEDRVWAFRRNIPVTEEMIKMYIEELGDLPTKEPDTTSLVEWRFRKGLTPKDYERLRQRYPDLKEAHQICMERLGEKMWGEAYRNKANWAATKHRLYRYSEDNAADDKHAAELSEGMQGSGNITVVLPPVERTNEVKENIKKD